MRLQRALNLATDDLSQPGLPDTKQLVGRVSKPGLDGLELERLVGTSDLGMRVQVDFDVVPFARQVAWLCPDLVEDGVIQPPDADTRFVVGRRYDNACRYEWTRARHFVGPHVPALHARGARHLYAALRNARHALTLATLLL
jgi:hypothetical protein